MEVLVPSGVRSRPSAADLRSAHPNLPEPAYSHPKLIGWVDEIATMCQPDAVVWMHGTDSERESLCQLMVHTGTLIPLRNRPNSYYARSSPDDVARLEDSTLICSSTRMDAGPTNKWMDPDETHRMLIPLFTGCMRGRTLYVIPYSMGAVGSPLAKVGIELTDSPYVVVSMMVMARVGTNVLNYLNDADFVKGLHSVGYPLDAAQPDVPWPTNKTKYITHFPELHEIWSFGSGYGGNALLGKKCFALRIASVLARDEGWFAEHMLLLKLTPPSAVNGGKPMYVCAAFPSQCGKTNMAMMTSALPEWSVELLGDDISWIKPGADGRFYAMNPEAGIFGVAPGTGPVSNPNALKAIERNTLFTNVALTPDGDVWFEELTKTPPPHLVDWLRRPWTPGCGRPAAHPNSRFTAPTSQCPSLAPEWECPEGVPIDAILFGGRRPNTVPLLTEAHDWAEGVFMGATLASEVTSAIQDKSIQQGSLRFDPFAMLPFCGYNMADYFAHWLAVGERVAAQHGTAVLPRIFTVNWFRKDPTTGKYMWPGFGENARVLKYIYERVHNMPVGVHDTPIGLIPTPESLDVTGLDVSAESLERLLSFIPDGWRSDLPKIRDHFARFGDRLPDALSKRLDTLQEQLASA